METIQNTALRLALGVWKSTRIANLQVEANVTPIILFIHQQSINYYYKMKSLGPNNRLYQQLFNNEDIRNKSINTIAKKPFVLMVQSLLSTWYLETNPNLKTINYPTIHTTMV